MSAASGADAVERRYRIGEAVKGVGVRYDGEWYEARIVAVRAESASRIVDASGCSAASGSADDRKTIVGPFAELARIAAICNRE